MEEGARRLELTKLAKSWGLNQHDHRIREFARDPSAMESVLRAEGFDIFVKIQLCYGGLAYDRYRGVLQHCAFRPPTLTSPRMRAGDTLAHQFAEQIAQSGKREEKDINNLVDGYALSELASYVSRGEAVRFYTQTASLRTFRNASHFRVGSESVFRGSFYYLMRCCFPALRFPHLPAITQQEDHGSIHSLEELRELSSRLKRLLAQADRPFQLESTMLSERSEVTGETLAELINGFYELKFLNHVFLTRWKLDPEMRHLAPSFATFFRNQSQRAVIRAEVKRSLVSLSEDLTSEVKYLTRWRSDILAFTPSLRSKRKELDGRTPDLWRDMGLGRWGLDEFLPPAAKQRLKEWIESVADSGTPVAQLASDLALQVSPEAYESVDDFALALCQLWLLKLHPRLIAEWRENADHFSQHAFVDVLQILYLIAEIRTIAPSFGEKQEAQTLKVTERVEHAAERLTRLDQSENPLIAGVGRMGLAHVTYWAWRRMKDLGQSSLAHAMAERSYDAASKAKDAFSAGSLAWAFAVNHAVYVGTVAKVRSADTNELRRELVHINQHHYHYRFADTLARRITESVHEELARVPGEEIVTLAKHRRLRVSLCRRVLDAQKTLDEAQPFFGDEEIERHLWELRDLALTLQCR
jgi:hypothetical protein